jgi:hypothetical protein
MKDVERLRLPAEGEQQLEIMPRSAEIRLLSPAERQLARFESARPILIVAIDTEAEFDWNGPFLRSQTSVSNVRNQHIAQEIFDQFGVRPVYLVDYAVATQVEGYLPLREIRESNRCEIGAHLHPWITPPFEEPLSNRTSFSQNLPAALQKEKLSRLTDAIVSNLRTRPICYRAGRYGVGEEIANILYSLDYTVDMSVQPGIDMRHHDGPDFRKTPNSVYWFGTRDPLLEIPATSGFVGLLAYPGLPTSVGVQIYKQIARRRLNRLGSLGIFARMHLLERIPLTPEGVTLSELRRVTTALLSRGQRVFVFSYHSSSLLPGNTEYVQSGSELSQFLARIAGYLEFFMAECGGESMTPGELRDNLVNSPARG